MNPIHYDVAIIGGGPAGLQAAVILARTRKRVIVFDSIEPPRNSASHGVHNFVGLDGLTPAQIREQAWSQIAVYNSAEHRNEHVIDVQSHDNDQFLVTSESGSVVIAKHVILALGFRDVYPDIAGFMACWGDTIIACPYCDGYENRDRMWGLVAFSQVAVDHMPHIYHNWTSTAKIIVPSGIDISDTRKDSLIAQGISVHKGDIVEVHHTGGKVEAVTLNTGEFVEVEALWWKLNEIPQPLTQKIITTFSLELDDNGYIKTDANRQTTTNGLWAVGDVCGWTGALGAAYQGSLAAYAISRVWYMEHTLETNS
jgi:thioredoxin reductase